MADLLLQYLDRQAAAHDRGLAASLSGSVVPYEAAPVQAVDPRMAWDEAVAVFRFFDSEVRTSDWPIPTDWPTLAGIHELAPGIAFSAGNFPQLVRQLYPLIHAEKLSVLQISGSQPVEMAELASWADQTVRKASSPQTLFVAGVLRLARQFDQADEWLKRHQAGMPTAYRAAWANEAAALAWHRGNLDEAAALWQSQATSVPVLFNRGMADLFRDRPAGGLATLSQAVAQIPEGDAWHHLGRLYLALAEMRSS
jgi:hypothetical protein